MFERRRDFGEGGFAPSPLKHPSPAIYACGLLPVILAGEGAGVR